MINHSVTTGSVTFNNALPFVLIAGPCVIESRDHAFHIAGTLAELTTKRGLSLVYKSSFDKANRTSAKSARGIGMATGLDVLAAIRDEFHIPVLTDVHDAAQCGPVGESVDILQIPAFLCRQTDLLLAAAKTGKAVNVKKGQFLAPRDMANVVQKLQEGGSDKILLCERGVSFGYNTLVSDFRSLPIMAETGWPVIFDATHSVQQPGGQGTSSGGERRFIPVLARAALAVGCAGLFIETHDNPDHAPSDGPNMLNIKDLPALLDEWQELDIWRKRGIETSNGVIG